MTAQDAAEDTIACNNEQPSLNPPPETKPFPLLSLPPELWVKIGKLIIDSTPLVTAYGNFQPRQRHTPQQPPLTHVCSLLRSELLPYYYKTRVKVAVGAYDPQVCSWLRAIGPKNRRLVTGLRIRVENFDFDEVEGRKIKQREERRIRQALRVEFKVNRVEGPMDRRWVRYVDYEITFL